MQVVTRTSGNGAGAIIARANYPLTPEVVEGLIALDEISQLIQMKRSSKMQKPKSSRIAPLGRATGVIPPLTSVVTSHQQNRCPINGCGAPIDEGDLCNNGHIVIQSTCAHH